MELKSIPLTLDAQLSGAATQLSTHRLHLKLKSFLLITLKDVVITLRTIMIMIIPTTAPIMNNCNQTDREDKFR